ncbi:MAG: DUF402 domain-containing protein [Bacilli bacterium]|nr:DUF402 domain-containing protein [Bacilli bacterium]MBN2877392.1 DUF402 domain-containing protein [Bacilli bacterium]
MTEKLQIVLHSYKHDQTLHRVWQSETLLDENEDTIIVANKRTRVVESNGRFWYTKEPSVSFFFKHHWYNVIGIIKEHEIQYYCNISSPILRDQEALKYIDYDLDIKVDGKYQYNVLDRNEYKRHQEQMCYPEEIKKILHLELQDLKQRIERRDFPFDPMTVRYWYDEFLKLEGE